MMTYTHTEIIIAQFALYILGQFFFLLGETNSFAQKLKFKNRFVDFRTVINDAEAQPQQEKHEKNDIILVIFFLVSHYTLECV